MIPEKLNKRQATIENRLWEYSNGHRCKSIQQPLEAGRRISFETCGLDDVFPPDDLGSGLYTPFIIYRP